jgi:glycosyltransferase involved in cell wall biosynthesis
VTASDVTRDPFFTVIVPAKKDARYLEAALDSLLFQTDPDWEAIVVYDGASDSMPDVLEAHIGRDSRIRAFHLAVGGSASAALNMGLRQAIGTWICLLNSDDLFEKNKLALHRHAIANTPDSHFFFSHYRVLHELTGEINNPVPRRAVSPPQLQLIGLLGGNYIQGTSVCVNREAWIKVGHFDEGLRHGQEYDMWLRMLARYPATHIPRATCITRWRADQATSGFPASHLFDSAKAAIGFLNRHQFPDLFPWVNLEDPRSARRALGSALAIAEMADSPVLYGLGAHPALLLRILEWAWSDNPPPGIVGALRRMVCRRAAACSRRHEDSNFGFLWRCARVATKLPQDKFRYEPVSAAAVAETHLRELETLGGDEAGSLRRYLQGDVEGAAPPEPSAGNCSVKEVIFVNQLGMSLGQSGVYGALRATLESAKYLMRHGVRVVVFAVADSGLTLREGVPVLGVRDEDALQQALGLWGPADTVVGISRADFLKSVQAKRVLVYHHNPVPVEGLAVDPVLIREGLNAAAVSIVCVSHFSRDSLVKLGLRADLVHVVPNGVDPDRFAIHPECARPAHSLIFAGHIVRYKGFDVALRAFEVLKSRFTDAVFNAYGRHATWFGQPVGWHGSRGHVFAPGWLDDSGFPEWNAIERDLPGFRYHGEVTQQQLAQALRAHSLLVLPSRIPETFGLVSLEAQACGCIPVLPRQGGFPETLLEDVTGFLYEENSAEGLCEKITELWTRHLPQEEQRVVASEWVRANHSWNLTGSSFQRILESIPERHDRTPIVFGAQ